MERLIISELLNWKNSPGHKPLVLRGARQVGKTWLINHFGRQYFAGRIHTVDLEKRTDWHRIFEKNLDPKRILSELELFLGQNITPGEDLLFLD